MCFKILYSVVVFPDPVGPVTNTIPCDEETAFRIVFRSLSSKPSCSIFFSPAFLFKIRITTRSLLLVGKIEIRKSTSNVLYLKGIAPSCGSRLSEISSLLKILIRVTTAE